MKNWNLPQGVERVRRTLWAAGHQAYPVGGCVRDLLLGRVPGDYDVTTSALPDRVEALFDRTVPTGKRHGTITVLTEDGPIEVTTFRREAGYADGRHPEAVTFDASLAEDLARRDFTINAMALDEDGNIIDPFGGQEDLGRRRIRCVGDPERRFSEDALRMYRAVRFAAQLEFEIEARTLAAIRACAPLASGVSGERVRAELEKTICSPCPGWVRLLWMAGLIPCAEHSEEGPFTPLAWVPDEPLARWAALCWALRTDPAPMLKALKVERRLYRACVDGYALRRAGLPAADEDWRRALSRYGEDAVRAAAWMGDYSGGTYSLALDSVLARAPCLTVKGLTLTGRDLAELGYSGTDIGAAQRFLLDHVLACPGDNTPRKLTDLLADAGIDRKDG